MVQWMLMVAIGLWMAVSGFTKSTAIPFKYLVARAQYIWKSKVYSFLAISGVLIAAIGVFFLIESVSTTGF